MQPTNDFTPAAMPPQQAGDRRSMDYLVQLPRATAQDVAALIEAIRTTSDPQAVQALIMELVSRGGSPEILRAAIAQLSLLISSIEFATLLRDIVRLAPSPAMLTLVCQWTIEYLPPGPAALSVLLAIASSKAAHGNNLLELLAVAKSCSDPVAKASIICRVLENPAADLHVLMTALQIVAPTADRIAGYPTRLNISLQRLLSIAQTRCTPADFARFVCEVTKSGDIDQPLLLQMAGMLCQNSNLATTAKAWGQLAAAPGATPLVIDRIVEEIERMRDSGAVLTIAQSVAQARNATAMILLRLLAATQSHLSNPQLQSAAVEVLARVVQAPAATQHVLHCVLDNVATHPNPDLIGAVLPHVVQSPAVTDDLRLRANTIAAMSPAGGAKVDEAKALGAGMIFPHNRERAPEQTESRPLSHAERVCPFHICDNSLMAVQRLTRHETMAIARGCSHVACKLQNASHTDDESRIPIRRTYV